MKKLKLFSKTYIFTMALISMIIIISHILIYLGLPKVYISNKEKESDNIIEDLIKEINKVDIKEILKEVLSKEDVEEKYVRDFLHCSMIDRNSEIVPIDKIMFIHKYGSKKSKKIAVDERLKMI